VKSWDGQIVNKEPSKCSALEFHDIDHLPPTLIGYVRYLSLSLTFPLSLLLSLSLSLSLFLSLLFMVVPVHMQSRNLLSPSPLPSLTPPSLSCKHLPHAHTNTCTHTMLVFCRRGIHNGLKGHVFSEYAVPKSAKDEDK
jgi:hypothetical protein